MKGDHDLPERSPCILSLHHPRSGRRLDLRAEVVWVRPGEAGEAGGVGLQLVDLDPELASSIERFVRSGGSGPGNVHQLARSLSLSDQQRLARTGTTL